MCLDRVEFRLKSKEQSKRKLDFVLLSNFNGAFQLAVVEPRFLLWGGIALMDVHLHC